MGCGVDVVCHTCKLVKYGGYGSYSSYKKRAEKILEDHVGHDVEYFMDDYSYWRDGILYASYPFDWVEESLTKGEVYKRED